MDLIFVLLIAAGALALGGVGGYLIFRYVLTGKYKEMVETATKEAEVIKEKKLLEVFWGIEIMIGVSAHELTCRARGFRPSGKGEIASGCACHVVSVL